MEKIKKQLLGVGIVIFIFICLYLIPSESSTESTIVEEPVVVEEPEFVFAEAKLSEENVKKGVSKILNKEEIINIQVNDGIIEIDCYVEHFWDNKHFMDIAARNIAKLSKEVFKNQNVKTVVYIQEVSVFDKYGIEEMEVGITLSITRETAEKINWENFQSKSMYDVAEYVYINPVLLKG